MESFSILGVFLLSVVKLKATSVSEFNCEVRNLTVTVDNCMWLYIDGVNITDLPNADDYLLADAVNLPCTTKLIAIHGRNGPVHEWLYGAILASTDDEFVLTNTSWKCSNVSHPGWEEIGFDDSTWVSAIEYGNNGEDAWGLIPGISTNAQWIWLRQWTNLPNSTYEEMDMEVYCRKKLDPNFCDISNPCQFGATCIDEPNGEYQCVCVPGYTGKDCATAINYCESDPCANEGTCAPEDNGYVCQCPPGYTGNHCEDVINYCESDPCANGGLCSPRVNGYVCRCRSGYVGDNCENEDPCDFYTGATTISSGTSSVRPTIDDPCLDRPCLNGATCVANCTTFSCICTEGYSGYICDVEINECETIPCYPFGDCNDFVGGYSCDCKGGYERINDTMCKETDFCANETEPCKNGGTCVSQNALNRYYCICPETDGKRLFVGLHCEYVLTTVTTPTVNGTIFPSSGIIAGGANVTISGQAMGFFEPLGAYLVDTSSSLPSLYAFVIPDRTSNDSITVQIPPAHSGYINHSLHMFVEYSGPINVTSDADKLIFKYTGNPVIHAIEPTDILVTGGVRLTVSGENMDSAQNPVMEITTFVVDKTAGSSGEEYHEICAQKNSSAITCLIPYGIVPESFINNTATAGKSLRGVFHLDSSLWAHKIGRRTKRAPVANLTDETGNTFEMYLGFLFDAFPTYENLSKSLPNITLNFVPLQVYFDPSCSMDFVTNKMDTISLSGKDLTYGCSKDDYTVLISNVTCVITSLTDSVLECQPPDDEPTINDPSAYCAHSSDPHPIKITVGTLTQHACCVSYTVDNTDLIIVVTVTCVVVVAIIILVAVLLYKRHKKNKVVKNANYNRTSVKSKDENEYDSVVGPPNGNDDAVLTHDRSYVGANHGKQTNVMAMAPQRGHPTAVQPDHDDYMQPRDIPAAVFDNHGGMGDTDIRGDSSGRTHDSYANAGLYGHRGEQHVEAYGVAIRRHKEPRIDNNLMEVDPEIDY